MKSKNISTHRNYDVIKSIALKAMFSDDELLETIVLKGGNALALIYKVLNRASIDLDFSIENEFTEIEFERIKLKVLNTIKDTFWEEGYFVFDESFVKRPLIMNEVRPPFWGGYRIEFKVIEKKKYKQFGNDLENLRRNALTISDGEKRKFLIDISKYEFCGDKQKSFIGDLMIYVYSPKMIVFEKLRAICQQREDYLKIINAKGAVKSERARDFYDIYSVITKLNILDFDSTDIEILCKIFAVKNVPVELLFKIHEDYSLHLLGFESLKSTIGPNEKVEDFSFYFNFNLDLINKLKSLLDNKDAIL